MANQQKKCAKCSKTVYPNDLLRAIDQDWHKWCLKCETCNTTLNSTTLNSFERKPYCRTHMPSIKHTTTATDVYTEHALNSQRVTNTNRTDQLAFNKMTEDKPTVGMDVHMQHALDSQKVTETGRTDQLAFNKMTEDKPTMGIDVNMQHALNSQKVTETGRSDMLTFNKFASERPDQSTY